MTTLLDVTDCRCILCDSVDSVIRSYVYESNKTQALDFFFCNKKTSII